MVTKLDRPVRRELRIGPGCCGSAQCSGEQGERGTSGGAAEQGAAAGFKGEHDGKHSGYKSGNGQTLDRPDGAR